MTEFVAWLLESAALTLMATAAIALVPKWLPAVRHRLWWLTLGVVILLPAGDGLLDRVALSTDRAVQEAVGAVGAVLAEGGSAYAADDAANTPGWVLPAPPRWLIVAAVSLWGAFVFVALVRLAGEARAAARIVRAALPVSDDVVARWAAVAAARRRGRRVRIVSADIRGACAIGIVRPSIVVSRSLLEQLDDAETETIVLHEQAHLQRYDDWTQLLQRIVLAVTGFHPAVRWISRQIEIEREAACDQLASRGSGSPITCARALARAAEISTRCPARTIRMAPGASLDDGGLQGRVTRLLSDRAVRPWIASSVALVEAAVILVAGTAVFQTQPVLDFDAASAVTPDVWQSVRAAAFVPPVETAGLTTGDWPDSALQPLAGLATRPIPVGPGDSTTRNGVSEKVSEPATSDGETSKEAQLEAVPSGPVFAEPSRVAVRGAEQTEHTATLWHSVSSVAQSGPASGEVLHGQALTPKVSIPLERMRLESVSLEFVAGSRWSQASERGADVGRSAAAAGQAIGRFFQRQGRAIARRF